MNSQEIRQSFLGFFEEKSHRVLPSSSVIPHDDPTLLFANAGMNQFKNVFTGKEKTRTKRAATVQKCIRAGGKHNDLDNVGYTARHLTFFEMLGNFSFRDYFKEGAIEYAWELLTERYGLDPARLWVTIYREDDEADEIWRKRIGVPADRVVRLGEKDNYWSMGEVGPCGPCSEILIDRGEKHSCGSSCGIGRCECDRYFELWNLVFMQFNQDESGKRTPLKKPCIDTGMGVERIAMVLQGVETVFETDVLKAIIRKIEEVTGVPAEAGDGGIPHRVIADHVRALVFAFADGAEPSNEGRGYVLRRILRRAARYGRKLWEEEGPLLSELVETVILAMEDAYPEIRQRQKYIEGVIRGEEERFGRTLDRGLQEFEKVVERLRASGEAVIPGRDAFVLYDTFGFPLDLVEQMAGEIDFRVDLERYEEEMKAQKERSRTLPDFAALVQAGKGESLELEKFPETDFVGYVDRSCSAELMGVSEGEDLWSLVVSRSPFYAESGGQVGDTGVLEGPEFRLRVEDTRKERGRWIHLARLVEGDVGQIRPGAEVKLAIDEARRQAIERNHTATHLLHAALRQVLGDHVHQKGSLVAESRLRFDVTHFSGISTVERERVEELVEEVIAGNAPVETFETDYHEAVRQGAMSLFGEKYGDRVRVVRIGDFSMELCGGTHVRHTGDIGSFTIAQEGSVSSGVRRLEALTEREAVRLRQRNARLLEEIALVLKVPQDRVLERIARLQEEVKSLRATRERSPGGEQTPEALGVRAEAIGEGETVQVYSGVIEEAGMDRALSVYDQLKSRTKRGIFILLARGDGKVGVVVALSPELARAGWDAREIFRSGSELLGGRGGGRPEMVRGGGSRPDGADAALAAMATFVRERAGG